jgi:hypothetical protein
VRDLSGLIFSASKVSKGNGKCETSLPSFLHRLNVQSLLQDPDCADSSAGHLPARQPNHIRPRGPAAFVDQQVPVLFLDILPFDIDPCLWTLKVALRFINGDASKPGNISSRILPMSIPVWVVVSEQGNAIVG